MTGNQNLEASGFSAVRASIAGVRERTARPTASAAAIAEPDR